MMGNKNIWAIGAALASAFFWSFSFIWFKVAFKGYEPLTVVIFRLVISAGLIISIAILLKRLQKVHKSDIKLFLLMSFFEPFIYFLGESYGLKYVSSTVAAVIVATIPLFTPLVARYFYKESISRMNVLGLVLSFVGVSMVVLNRSFQLEASPLGVGLEFIAVFAAIAYAILLKKLASRYNTLTIIAYQNLIGVILFLPLWLIFDLKSFVQAPYHPEAFRAIVLLAIFSSTLAFVFFTQSVRWIGVTRSNTFINLIPVFVAIFSYLILKESLSFQKVAGILVVVTGLFLAQLGKPKTKKVSPVVEVHRK